MGKTITKRKHEKEERKMDHYQNSTSTTIPHTNLTFQTCMPVEAT